MHQPASEGPAGLPAPSTSQPLLSGTSTGGWDAAQHDQIPRSGTWIRLDPEPRHADRELVGFLGCPRYVRKWAILLVLALVLTTGYVVVLLVYEHWNILESVFFAVSIGYSVGMVPKRDDGFELLLEDDVAVLCTCVFALAGMVCLACVGALLVQHVLMRDEKFVRRELERHTKASRQATSQNDDGAGGGGHRASGGGSHLGGIRRFTRRPRAWEESDERRISGQWHNAVLVAWLVALLCGYLYGLYGELPGRAAHKASPHPFALLFAVSTITGIGAISPNDSKGGLLFATVYVIVGVPLNAAMLAMFVDKYLSRVQQREAKRKVLGGLSRQTFDALAGTRSTLATHEGHRVVITWAVFLEHKLRELAGTPLSAGLLDSIRETFVALGGRKGYLDQDDLGIADPAGVVAGGSRASPSVSIGQHQASAFCDGGPLTPSSRTPSWQYPASLGASPLGAFCDGGPLSMQSRSNSWQIPDSGLPEGLMSVGGAAVGGAAVGGATATAAGALPGGGSPNRGPPDRGPPDRGSPDRGSRDTEVPDYDGGGAERADP